MNQTKFNVSLELTFLIYNWGKIFPSLRRRICNENALKTGKKKFDGVAISLYFRVTLFMWLIIKNKLLCSMKLNDLRGKVVENTRGFHYINFLTRIVQKWDRNMQNRCCVLKIMMLKSGGHMRCKTVNFLFSKFSCHNYFLILCHIKCLICAL